MKALLKQIADWASPRVLKKRAAQSHLSMRTECLKDEEWNVEG